MLSNEMFSEEYIRILHRRTGNDPALLERVVYAFGLLEAIRKVNLPFCFKGGTALMLLLKHPKRLSTDIDIVVEPGTDIDGYIQRAGAIFPFSDVEEDVRIGKNKIEKRHFRFRYRSPRRDTEVTILLDVLFEHLQYEKTVELPIRNELLLTEGEDLTVLTPDVNGILGDKLTAFAPHTTGIRFGTNKELEIIKQLFDCKSLFDEMTDFEEVRRTYQRVVKDELAYRGLDLPSDEVLKDTANACICIASRGLINSSDYIYYKDGIFRIRNHIFGESFSGEIAGACAAVVLFLVAGMLSGAKVHPGIGTEESYADRAPEALKPKRYTYLRIVDRKAYAYLIEASQLLKDTGIEL